MRFTGRGGEVVEAPGGLLRTQIRNGKPHREVLKKRRNVNTGKIFKTGIVAFRGRRRVIKFEPDMKLNLDHCAEFPPPSIPPSAWFWPAERRDPEQAEIWKLAAELLGHPVDTATVAVLQEAADQYSRQPGALLLMLKRRRERGHRPPTVEALAHDLATMGFR